MTITHQRKSVLAPLKVKMRLSLENLKTLKEGFRENVL
jgi:hypothetical protein